MRIAFNTLNENPQSPSNAARFIRNLVIALSERAPEHEYVLYVSPDGKPLFDDVVAQCVSRRVMRYSNEARLRRIAMEQGVVPARLVEDEIDVLHCICGVLPLRTRVASVLNICTMHHKLFPRQIGYARSAFRSVMFDLSVRNVSLVVANSHSNMADILRYLPIGEDRIVLIPEALDTMYLQPADPDESARTLAELGVQRPYILFASALFRYKNLETLLDAFALLRKTGATDHQLVAAGHGHPRYVRTLTERAAALGIAGDVRFVGHQPAAPLRSLYAEADVFVYPSLYETFGHPPLQAMGQDTAVIASDTSSIPEVLGDAALLFPPRDAGALHDALRSLLDDDTLRKEMVDKGHARARLYSWDRTASGILAAYTAAAGAR